MLRISPNSVESIKYLCNFMSSKIQSNLIPFCLGHRCAFINVIWCERIVWYFFFSPFIVITITTICIAISYAVVNTLIDPQKNCYKKTVYFNKCTFFVHYFPIFSWLLVLIKNPFVEYHIVGLVRVFVFVSVSALHKPPLPLSRWIESHFTYDNILFVAFFFLILPFSTKQNWNHRKTSIN